MAGCRNLAGHAHWCNREREFVPVPWPNVTLRYITKGVYLSVVCSDMTISSPNSLHMSWYIQTWMEFISIDWKRWCHLVLLWIQSTLYVYGLKVDISHETWLRGNCMKKCQPHMNIMAFRVMPLTDNHLLQWCYTVTSLLANSSITTDYNRDQRISVSHHWGPFLLLFRAIWFVLVCLLMNVHTAIWRDSHRKEKNNWRWFHDNRVPRITMMFRASRAI